MKQLILAASTTGTLDLVERLALPVLLAFIALASALGGVLLGHWAAERERRRDRYADAVRTLIAWNEFPYRIRRRTDDNPATLNALAELGHTLQEQIRYHQTWVAAESPSVGDLYSRAIANQATHWGAMCKAAWNTPPAGSAAAMNLGLDLSDAPNINDDITPLQTAISDRFGWRRVYRSIFRRNDDAGRDRSL